MAISERQMSLGLETREPTCVTWTYWFALVDDKLRVMVTNRISDGSVTFVGGKVEKGERFADAASRENEEEADIHDKSFKGIGLKRFVYDGHEIEVFAFAGVYEGAVKEKEVKLGKWRWESLTQLAAHVANGKLPSVAIEDGLIRNAAMVAFEHFHPQSEAEMQIVSSTLEEDFWIKRHLDFEQFLKKFTY